MESNKPVIIVWFSCGAASAVAAYETLKMFPDCDVRIVNNPIKNENPDNIRFLKDVEKWLGVKIEFAINKKYPSCDITQVFNDRKYMSGTKGAPCTVELKKEARYQFELENKIDYHVMGFTSEELHRHKRFTTGERQNLLPVLIALRKTKEDCFKIITDVGILLPISYRQGSLDANWFV